MACRQMVERQHLGSTHNSRQCSLIQVQKVEWQTPNFKWPAGVMQQLYRFEAGSVVYHRGTEYSSSRLSLRSPSLASISISSSTDLPSSDSLPCSKSNVYQPLVHCEPPAARCISLCCPRSRHIYTVRTPRGHTPSLHQHILHTALPPLSTHLNLHLNLDLRTCGAGSKAQTAEIVGAKQVLPTRTRSHHNKGKTILA